MDAEICELFGISPVLPVRDLQATVAYYAERLGFTPEPLWGDPPTHGSVHQGRVGIQFTQAPAAYVAADYPGWIYVFVTDVDRVCERYRANGVTITREPASYEYGMREFEVRDLNGYRLRFGQYLTN